MQSLFRFFDNFTRLFVIPQSNKLRMSKMIALGPFRVFDLRDQLRLEPYNAFHHFCCDCFTSSTIDDLKEGQRYIVTQSFATRSGSKFQTGEMLTYRGQQYIDHVGHVLEFEERTLNLHEEKDAAVLRKIWAFLKPAP